MHSRQIKKAENRVKKEIADDEVNDYIISAKRIKVQPLNKSSRKTINDGFAVCRKLWNCCVNEININPKATQIDLRNAFITKKNMTSKNIKQLEWTFRISQKVRESVTRKFAANYETAQKNFEKYTRKFFYKIKKKKNKKVKRKVKKKIVMQFKDKKAETQTIYLNKEICEFRICEKTNKTILKTFNGVEVALNESYTNFDTSTRCDRCKKVFVNDTGIKAHLRIKKPCKESNSQIKSGIPHAELTLQRVGYEYFLYVPEYTSPKLKDEAPDNIVGIDAGWNTLLTYYSPNGEWGEICPGIKNQIQKVRDNINILVSNKSNKPPKVVKKAVQKRVMYITNMMNDMHWKLCHWILSKFRKIIISRLYVARCSKAGKQTQADLRLCTFVDRLIHKSIEYKNSEIHVCKEHYTSQACTKCFSLNTVKDKTVRCKDCGNETHRDLNGARNIFLKHCY